LAPTPHLDGRHTVFGEVTDGQQVVSDIGSCATGPGDKPVDEIRIEKISVERV
jgi:cyclophilin family peptidyl-prolyl cis-trans isomerase